MTPTVVQFPNRKFVGLKTQLRQSKASANDMSSVPLLWQQLTPLAATLKNRIGGERYALITGDLPYARQDEALYYALFAVSDFDNVPDTLEQYEISAGKSVKIIHQGLPQTIGKTAAAVFFQWLPQSGEYISSNSELFVYPEGYDRTNPEGSFDYYLFLK